MSVVEGVGRAGSAVKERKREREIEEGRGMYLVCFSHARVASQSIDFVSST